MATLLYKWLIFSLLSFVSPVHRVSPSFSTANKHPFYVSVTEINHNAQDKSFEVSCKIFADDMEATLEQQFKTVLDFTNEKQKVQIDGLIKSYVPKHLQLKADGKTVALNYVGFERESEAVYCYFEGTNITTAPKQVSVDNSLLQDYTDKQINIVHVIVNGKRQSTKLDNVMKNATLNF